jgi:ParB family chromosome partitioning protein
MEEQLKKLKVKSNNDSTVFNALIDKDNKTAVLLDIESVFPSPDEWNFYPEISEKKMIEMMLSIMENGLFNPIIVWQQGNKYQILSGHNRVIAYKRIVNEYSSLKNFDINKYKKIPAIVYKEEELDELKAREIIIDTNYIQREEDKSLTPTIIKHRLEILRNRKDIKGRTIDILAKELGISSTKVYEDHVIATKIIPELNEFFFNNKIRKKSLLRFAWFNKETQKKIYKEYNKELTDDRISKLKKGMTGEEIRECFKGKIIRKTLVTVSVPESLAKEFKIMSKIWLKEKMLKAE